MHKHAENQHGETDLSLKNIESNQRQRYNLIGKNTRRRELITIYRQEIMQDITLFTALPKANFYSELFLQLDTDNLQPEIRATGRKGYNKSAMLCAFVVMKCEGFTQITDLVDYLQNNLLIAYYCGFDITKPLPSYWTFGRFLRETDNEELKKVMQKQVEHLVKEGMR